jgi:eukaryotic-like serine/threonine-protein kinase
VARTLSDPLVGRLLDGRYRVESRLAQGGMSTVYLALDTRLDRTVALKVMHPGLAADPDFVARFSREAKSAARLTHPDVVAVYDQGRDGGEVFLAMEYVEGRTLRDLLRERGRLTPAEALGVLEAVLAALGAAHRAGLMHRDVKPENVLLADDGRVKVADFGLARAVTATASSTMTRGLIIGTVAYLSPEQVERGISDARSDVYSAGILLFEMLTGRKPYDGDSPIHVAYRHVHEDVPLPSTGTPGIPSAVDELVARATRRDPAERPADANAFLADVTPVRHLLGPAAQPADVTHTAVLPAPDPPAPQPYPRRRRRGGALVLLLVLALAVAAGVGAWWLASGQWTRTPSVLERDRAGAVQLLESAGFDVAFPAPDWSEDVPVGLVVRTEPGPGDRIRRGGTVDVVLSRGKERYAVPPVAGLAEAAAGDALAARNLTVGQVARAYSDTVPAGRVIGSDPPAGRPLRRDTGVDLVVSRGVEPVEVPDVVGDRVGAAAERLAAAGLRAARTERFDDKVGRGRVISQSPDDGTAPKNSVVELVVSKGPQLFPVPRVEGSDKQSAEARLRAAGFDVRVLELPGGPDSVLAQSPGPGSLRARGSTITLSVF